MAFKAGRDGPIKDKHWPVPFSVLDGGLPTVIEHKLLRVQQSLHQLVMHLFAGISPLRSRVWAAMRSNQPKQSMLPEKLGLTIPTQAPPRIRSRKLLMPKPEDDRSTG